MLKGLGSDLVVVLMEGGVWKEHEGHTANEALIVALSLEFTEEHNNEAFHHRGTCGEVLIKD